MEAAGPRLKLNEGEERKKTNGNGRKTAHKIDQLTSESVCLSETEGKEEQGGREGGKGGAHSLHSTLRCPASEQVRLCFVSVSQVSERGREGIGSEEDHHFA